MPTFQHNLLGIGKLCDHGCKVLFDSNAVTVFSKNNKDILLKGWRDTTSAKLWRLSLRPEDNPISSIHPSAPTPPAALYAHDLPSDGALVRYLHTAAGFPVKSTWLAAIKDGNLSTWTGLTYTNASRYCPTSEETIKGHLTQSKQGVRSTKTGPPSFPTPPAANSKNIPSPSKSSTYG